MEMGTMKDQEWLMLPSVGDSPLWLWLCGFGGTFSVLFTLCGNAHSLSDVGGYWQPSCGHENIPEDKASVQKRHGGCESLVTLVSFDT